jgi:hypothetical protein
MIRMTSKVVIMHIWMLIYVARQHVYAYISLVHIMHAILYMLLHRGQGQHHIYYHIV